LLDDILGRDFLQECIKGLKKAKKQDKKSVNFEEWIVNNLGESTAKYFMFPFLK